MKDSAPQRMTSITAMEPVQDENVDDDKWPTILCDLHFKVIGRKLHFEFHQPQPPYNEPFSTVMARALDANYRPTHKFRNHATIWLTASSRVIVRLNSENDWKFWPEERGLRIESVDLHRVVNLRHATLDPNGQLSLEPLSPRDVTCQVISFDVVTPPAPWPRGRPVNLFIATSGQDGVDVPLIVDPDVKNGGPPQP